MPGGVLATLAVVKVTSKVSSSSKMLSSKNIISMQAVDMMETINGEENTTSEMPGSVSLKSSFSPAEAKSKQIYSNVKYKICTYTVQLFMNYCVMMSCRLIL